MIQVLQKTDRQTEHTPLVKNNSDSETFYCKCPGFVPVKDEPWLFCFYPCHAIFALIISAIHGILERLSRAGNNLHFHKFICFKRSLALLFPGVSPDA